MSNETVWAIAAAVFWAAFLVLELTRLRRYGSAGTFSAALREWSKRRPILTFFLGVGVGVLAMHLWG